MVNPQRTLISEEGLCWVAPGLFPYLILTVGEVVNHMVKRAMANGEFEGIILPKNHHIYSLVC
jgi:hypothetical protein